MNEAFLQTKFHIPAQPPSTLSRQQLLSRLNRGLGDGGRFSRRLTLITAPAGYGKTTLAVSWIKERVQAGAWQLPGGEARAGERATVVWLALEPGDDRTERFWRYLLAALKGASQEADEALLGALPKLEASAPLPPVPALARNLVNALAITKEPYVLALDDYHHAAGPATDETLAFILAHQPANLHVLLTSRGEPQGLPLAQLSARQQLLALAQDDLCFTTAESAQFLRMRLSRSVADHDLETITSRAGGWAAGLQLAALALQREGSALPDALGPDNERLANYLAQEILAQLPRALQTFLLRTSILNRLCPALCQALTAPIEPGPAQNDANTASPLAELEARGLFISRTDGRGNWYRYHDVFASFLRRRLVKQQPELVPDLHRRAAEWHRQDGSPQEAVHHAWATGDTDYALAVIEGYTPWLLKRGELTTLIAWLEPVSQATLQKRPTLGLDLAWAYLIQGWRERAAAQVAMLESALRQEQRADLLAIRLALARRRGEIDAARLYANEAQTLEWPEDAPSGGIIDLYRAELQLGRGESAQARRLIVRALESFRVGEQPFLETQALYYLINAHILQGQLQEAAALCREALNVMERHDLPYRLGGFHNRLALLHWEWGRLEEAADFAEASLSIARSSEQIPFFVNNALLLASVWRDQGHEERVASLLDEVRDVAAGSPGAMAQLTYWQAWSALRAGEPGAAAQWIAARGLGADDDPDYYTLDGYLLLARLLRLREQEARAQRLLRRLARLARQVGDAGAQIQVLLERAQIYNEGNKRGLARQMVEEALVAGSSGGYVQRFVNAGAPVGLLLARTGELYAQAAAPFSDGYLQRLLVACGVDAEAERDVKRLPFKPQEALTPRELEILQLLALGLTNPQIATELHISVGTVRWHLKNVYRKLDVNNRVQAARRLEEMGEKG